MKCLAGDILQAGGQDYSGQLAAIGERAQSDFCATTGQVIAPCLARRILDERKLIFIEQNSVHTAEEGTRRIHRDCGQVGAGREWRPIENTDAAGNEHRRQTVAIGEGGSSNAGDAVGDREGGQTGAGIKRPVPDVGDAAGKGDTGQAGARIERIVSDVGNVAGNHDTGEVGAETERPGPDAGDAGGDGDVCQAAAGSESIGPDVGNAVGNRDAGQVAAFIERPVSDAEDTIWYHIASGFAARTLSGDSVGNRNTG